MPFYLPSSTWRKVAEAASSIRVKVSGFAHMYIGEDPTGESGFPIAGTSTNHTIDFSGRSGSIWLLASDVDASVSKPTAVWIDGNGTFIPSDVLPARTLSFVPGGAPYFTKTGFGKSVTGGYKKPYLGVTFDADIPGDAEVSIRAAIEVARSYGGAYVQVLSTGQIKLNDQLDLDVDNCTWDFTKAPGFGCYFSGSRVRISASNVVVIGISCIPMSGRNGQVYESRDGLTIGGNKSISGIYVRGGFCAFSTDECFSTWSSVSTDTITDVTVDGMMFAEPLAFPRDYPNYTHGHPMNWLIGSNTRRCTFTHCLSVSGYQRNFLVTPYNATSETNAEVINCIIGNWGLQATQISFNTTGAQVSLALENTIYLTGGLTGVKSMTALQPTREMIFLNSAMLNTVYFNNIVHWACPDGTITATPLNPSPTNGVSAIAQVRDVTTSTIKHGSDVWGNPANAPVVSDAPRLPLDQVYDEVRARVGTIWDGRRNPISERILNYALPERTGSTLEAAPFLASRGYNLQNKKGVLDEFISIGVVVTPSVNTLSVLVPTLPGNWSSYIVEASPVQNKVDETGWTALSDVLLEQLRPSGHLARKQDFYCSTLTPGDDSVRLDWESIHTVNSTIVTPGSVQLNCPNSVSPTWVVRVGYVSEEGVLWVESGLLWYTGV